MCKFAKFSKNWRRDKYVDRCRVATSIGGGLAHFYLRVFPLNPFILGWQYYLDHNARIIASF